MTRIAQPLEVAELKGATKKNPQRYRLEPVKSKDPIGNCPPNFNDAEKQAWKELLNECPKGVLTAADRKIVETLAVLIAGFREEKTAYPANKIGQMISCLARLGMTPSDRQRIGVEKEKDENPFNQF